MPPETSADRSIVGVAIVVEAGLGVAALAVGWLFGLAPLASISWNARDGAYGLLAAAPMAAALWVMTRWPIGPLTELERLVRETVVPLFRGATMVELLLICAAAGLGEELLFRGVVQAGIERLWGAPWPAIVLASVVFGIAHPISTTYAVLAGVIGAYLGWLFVATENLLVSIIAHAVYDLIALVYLLRRREPLSEGEVPEVVDGI